jgi:dihydroceramide fatty acyl 2-hydroxylase
MFAPRSGRKYASRAEKLKASPPIFDKPPWLDRVTRVHPMTVPTLFLPIIAVFAYLAFANARTWAVLVGLVAGYVIWTLTEYWLHRIVFHFEPEEGFGAQLHWMIHGVHHDHPNDPLRLVMPPSASLPLAALFALIFWLVLPFGTAMGVSAGFFAGYLAYDMTHYFVHHGKPRTWLGHKLREWHMRHHFQDHTAGFGISAPYWDVIFRTTPGRTGNRRHAQQVASAEALAEAERERDPSPMPPRLGS